MNLQILIGLPRDRAQPGTLSVLRSGQTVFVCPALGKTANSIAVARGNPRRNPLRRGGDTPLGEYAPARIIRYGRNRPGIGRIALPLDPIAGQAQEAERNGRDGLLIHGGRGNKRLLATAGCVRLLDVDMARLANVLKGARASVSIIDIETSKPNAKAEVIAKKFLAEYAKADPTTKATIRAAIC